MGYEIIWDVNRHLLLKDKDQFENNSVRSSIFVEYRETDEIDRLIYVM
jgi:hypothetical protein